MEHNESPKTQCDAKNRRRANKTVEWVRRGILFAVLATVTYETVMHQIVGGGKAPSVHALCPYGALESLYSLLTTGSLIQKIFSGTLVLFVLTVVLALVFRRSFCGMLCPFGALQELFGRMGRKIFSKRLTIPVAIDKPLRSVKYAVLILTVVMAWLYGSLWMAPYDPYSAYGHIIAVGASIAEDPLNIVGFALLAITIIGSLLYDRFFCKYLCPVGVLYGILGKLSPAKIERDSSICVNCKLCTKACPMNIDVANLHKVTSAECINCNECVTACPQKGALDVKIAHKPVRPFMMLVLVVGIFFGTILAAQALGIYEVLPKKAQAGSATVEDIKGYNTIEDAAKLLGVSTEEVYMLLNIPKTVPVDTMMKNISKVAPGYDLDAEKENAGQMGATETNTEEAAQEQAASIPVNQPEVQSADKGNVTAAPSDSRKIEPEIVRGSMTILEVADALNIPVEDVYTLFKIKSDIPAQTRMKDIATIDPSYDFHAIKEQLESN